MTAVARRRIIDLGLVAVAFVVGIADVPEDVDPWLPWSIVAAAVTALAALTVVRRATWPWGLSASFGSICAVAIGASVVGEPGQLPFGHVLVVAGLLAHAAWSRPQAQIGALALAALATASIGEVAAEGRDAGDAMFTALVWSVAMSGALAVRWRRQAVEATADRIRAEERQRIARELHDVVAHHVSAIAMTAEGARSANDLVVADRSLQAIHGAAATTLDEMRRVVAVLRDPAAGVPSRLSDLVDGFSEVDGPAVVVELCDDHVEPPAPVAAAIHRIALESVTNARRHAVGATIVNVRIDTDPTRVRLIVDDDGRVTAAPTLGGHGLVGMSERAHALGGRLAAGPRDDGGWRVVAEIPTGPGTSAFADAAGGRPSS